MDLSPGQLLRQLRHNQGLKLRTLAVRLGVDASYISRIENDRMAPAPHHIRAWAEALAADADAIFYAFGLLPPDLKQELTSNESARRDVRALLTG